MSASLEPVIGLEVHVQLGTATKIFCGCSTTFGAAPNTHICPVCTGQPGALPVLNAAVVSYALKMGIATGCEIRRTSRFARKNYFYPDLPKGYQISQYEQPIAEAGAIVVAHQGKFTRVGITRIHLEEDAGKTIHRGGDSAVDLNRAGVPLIEIVSEPEITSPEQAAQYMRCIRGIVRALGISDGNMEQGSLRCDANISLRPVGETTLGTKVEIKNLNSFRFVQKALQYEIERQERVILSAQSVVQETRLWNTAKNVTESMRSKEEAHDYRYFPDPDLPPLRLAAAEIDALIAARPELPVERRQRFGDEIGLTDAEAAELTRERELADYFEQCVAAGAPAKKASNWIRSELLSQVEDPRDVLEAAVGPKMLAGLIALIESGKITGKLAKEIWPKMWESGRSAATIATEENLFAQSDSGAIAAEVDRVLADHRDKVAEYRSGKAKLFGFFVGQVMKATKGKANPKLVNDLLKERLDK